MFRSLRGLKLPVVCVITSVMLAGVCNAQATGSSLKVNQKVRVTDVKGGGSELVGYIAGLDKDTLRLRTKSDVTLNRVVTNDSVSYEFPYLGARYEVNSKSIVGVSNDGSSVIVPISQVSYAEVTLFVQDRAVPVRFSRGDIERRLPIYTIYPLPLGALPVDSIASIKVWHPANSTGIVLFAMAGGALGLTLGLSQESRSESGDIYSSDYLSGLGTAIAVAGGFVVGALVGSGICGGRWQTVPLDRLKAGPTVSATNGPGLACSLRF
ncbi:MAG: hypothetical protein AB1483_05355 [Candidatus Zixiibacteriota bacterium]